jgi:hypothetical protein
LIGEEDVMFNKFYKTTVTCISKAGELFRMKKEDLNRYLNMGGGTNLKIFTKESNEKID